MPVLVVVTETDKGKPDFELAASPKSTGQACPIRVQIDSVLVFSGWGFGLEL